MKMQNPGEKILMISPTLQVVHQFSMQITYVTKKRKSNAPYAMFFF